MSDLDEKLSAASAAVEMAKAEHGDGSPEHLKAQEALAKISREIGTLRPPMGSKPNWRKL